ncbi:MAG: D-2-hydroxyacid dehydrogenase [Oscillospiraceae bacterium]
MKIVVLDGFAANPGDISWDGIRSQGELFVYERTQASDIIERIGDAQIACTNKCAITAEIMDACPSLKLICVFATGYNIIDVEAAKARGVLVANIPAYSTNSVAQMTFALILELCHHVGEHSHSVHTGAWVNSRDFTFWNYPLIELSGKTLGLVGFGQIGHAVAKIALAMNMNVLVNRQNMTKPLPEGAVTYASIDELLAQSDIVSLHCPLTKNNSGFINKASIAEMKDGAMLINTARGALVNECDLAEALKSGKLFGAAVDVLGTEPPKGDNPLLACDNCVITPHIAWAPKEARLRLFEIAERNIKSFIEGNPINIVNR